MRIRNIPLVILIILQFINLSAQVKLIPNPKRIELYDSGFIIGGKTSIVGNTTDKFYISELKNCIKQELDINLKTVKTAKNNYIEFIKVSDPVEFVHILVENMLDAGFYTGPEGYILKITPETARIFSQTETGIFYGMQTLKQLITANREKNKIPCLVIYDSPDIPVRGWQDDISRGPIPTMDLLKEQIRTMSSFKLNYFTLYTEHVFKLQKHPGIAPDDGITKEELRELSKFAKKHHVKLIGNYQSFGHMEETLAHPDYSHLGENHHIISPAMEESYDFLGDVYGEIVPEYDGKYFNINCDETFGLGEGKSRDMVDSIGIPGVYIKHINRLNDLLKPYGKKILMWGDIVTSYPEIIPQLPHDITVMAWGYHAADSFDEAIIPIASRGLGFWIAPGINCWRNIYPNLQATEINIYNFIRDGYKHKAGGVLNTSWDDDGLNLFHNNWFGFAWGAENSWNAPSDLPQEESDKTRKYRYENFNKSFDALFFGLKGEESLTDQMADFSEIRRSGIDKVLTNNRFFEPIFPLYSKYLKEGKIEENLSVLNQLDIIRSNIKTILPKITKNIHIIENLLFAVKQVQFTINKNLFRIEINKLLNNRSMELIEKLKIKKGTLICELKNLKEEYIYLWNKENRSHWLSENRKHFNSLKSHLEKLGGYCMIDPANEVSREGRKIVISSVFNELPIHYSLEGSPVTPESPRYTAPFFIKKNVTIRARSFDNEVNFNAAEKKLLYHMGIGRLHKLNSTWSQYHPSYDGGGKHALLDGETGDKEQIRSGKWQGFSGQDIDIEIDLGKKKRIRSFSMGFFQNTRSWVIFPKQVEIYTKKRLKGKYKLNRILRGAIPPEEKNSLKKNYTTVFYDLKTRFVKIVARHYGKLPEWHHAGSEYDSMIFADEIILR